MSSSLFYYTLHGAIIRKETSPCDFGSHLSSIDSLFDLCQEFNHILSSVINGEKSLVALVKVPISGSVLKVDLSDRKYMLY